MCFLAHLFAGAFFYSGTNEQTSAANSMYLLDNLLRFSSSHIFATCVFCNPLCCVMGVVFFVWRYRRPIQACRFFRRACHGWGRPDGHWGHRSQPGRNGLPLGRQAHEQSRGQVSPCPIPPHLYIAMPPSGAKKNSGAIGYPVFRGTTKFFFFFFQLRSVFSAMVPCYVVWTKWLSLRVMNILSAEKCFVS